MTWLVRTGPRRAFIVIQVIIAAAVVLTGGLTGVDAPPTRTAPSAAATHIDHTIGGVIGTGPRPSAPPVVPADGAHPADVLLCGAYVRIHAKMVAPHRASGDIWVANRYRLALSQSPDASAEVRAAITADADALDAQIASFPELQPFEQPPNWHIEEPQAAVERITRACRLS